MDYIRPRMTGLQPIDECIRFSVCPVISGGCGDIAYFQTASGE